MRVMRTANVGQGRVFFVQFVPLFRFSPKGYELGNIFGRILTFFCRIIKSVEKEKTLQITEFVGFISFLSLSVLAVGRRERDLYPPNFIVYISELYSQNAWVPDFHPQNFTVKKLVQSLENRVYKSS